MRIENKPFPHIIIEDHFNDDEYNLIWREIKFLSDKLKKPEQYSAAKDIEGNYLTNSLALSLDSSYNDRNISDILSIFYNKIFLDMNFIERIVSENEYWNCIKYSNSDYTKLRKYFPSSRYNKHIDPWVNALVSTTFQEVDGSGGDLFFPNHSYIIECKDNQTVIFPGWVAHEVTTVNNYDRYAITKFIHCAMHV